MSHTLSFAVDTASPGVGLPATAPLQRSFGFGTALEGFPALWVDDSRMLLSLYKQFSRAWGLKFSATSSSGRGPERCPIIPPTSRFLTMTCRYGWLDVGFLMERPLSHAAVILYSVNNSFHHCASLGDAVCAKLHHDKNCSQPLIACRTRIGKTPATVSTISPLSLVTKH